VTTTEPNAGDQKRGRHAKRDDADRPRDPADDGRPPAHAASDDDHDRRDDAPEDDAPETPTDDDVQPPDEQPGEPDPRVLRTRGDQPQMATSSHDPTASEAREKPRKKRTRLHAIAHHPAGASLLTSAGLLTGLALAPLLFDQLRFEVATRAADAARSAAAPWPAGGEPWVWPGWVATLVSVVAVAVLVVAALGVRLPDLAVLVAAVVLAVTTARAAWATLDVLNAHLWELIPLCIVCLMAFGSAVAAALRWRSTENTAAGAGTGEVAGVTLGAWLLVVLLLLGGSAIASSAETHAFGNVTSPPQHLAGLLSVRAGDARKLHDLRGDWVAQVGAAQVRDDAATTAYAVTHHDWTTKFPTLLARGDDLAADLDGTWWVSVAAQPFGSEQEAAAWCGSSGIAGCTPRRISG
jgi:hypothetical protein